MLKLTASETDTILKTLRAAQLEFVTLKARLPNPYRENVRQCAEECKTAIDLIELALKLSGDFDIDLKAAERQRAITGKVE